jgi:hypothetical protein
MHGGWFPNAYAAPKTVSVKGGFAVPWNTLSPFLDALKAALAAGPANLQVDSRYYRSMQCVKYNETYEPTGRNRVATIEIEFEGPDPFAYNSTAAIYTYANTANGATQQLICSGNAYFSPIWNFTVGGSGAQTIAWTLTNTTTGDFFTLTGSVNAGNVIIVNTVLRTVTISGVDRMDLFDGVFWTPSASSITTQIGVTSGIISSLSVDKTDRWW